MAMINPFILANKQGIPQLEATGVTSDATTTTVTYSFAPHRFVNAPYNGLIAFKLPERPSGTSTYSIRFTSPNGGSVQLQSKAGAATGANIPGAGIYVAYYDYSTGLLQLI